MHSICSSCGQTNPEGAKFCSECGSRLSSEAPKRKERKLATALFADLVGSTSMTEKEDPEVVQAVVGRAFDRLSEEVQRYGGLLEKFMGDALLAVFGVPTVHEDDSERAVRCALEMQEVLSELNRNLDAQGKPGLAMRVGVESGQVLVDLERASGSRDRMLTGDAVNTAARLERAAEPGAVFVGPAAYSVTKDVVDYRELPALELKGKSESVPAWRAVRIVARRGGSRPPLGLEAGLIGRDEEMAVLKQTLHRVASEERAALVTVMGPAGVGKSRITWELMKYVDGLPQTFYWRQGRCPPYGGGAYSALAEAIKSHCGIRDDDPPQSVTSKVEAAVAELFGAPTSVEEIESLVGAVADKAFSREHLFESWRRFLERMAMRNPLLLVLEDIHWADDGLLDFLDYLADWGRGPILVLALARPELIDRRPTWGGGKRNFNALYLDPLSQEENEAMLDDLLSSTLPDSVKHLIVDRSEGNPLFTEEIVRMFIDRGLLRTMDAGRWEIAGPVEDVEVPRSIHGLIAARLDGLPTSEKTILQDASVIGRVFWTGAAAHLGAATRGEARDLLGRLRVKEVIVPPGALRVLGRGRVFLPPRADQRRRV